MIISRYYFAEEGKGLFQSAQHVQHAHFLSFNKSNSYSVLCGVVVTVSRDLKIRRRRVSTTADLVEGGWGEVAVAMAGKLSLRYARDGGAFSKFRKCFKNSAKGRFKDLCMFSCRLS